MNNIKLKDIINFVLSDGEPRNNKYNLVSERLSNNPTIKYSEIIDVLRKAQVSKHAKSHPR